MNWIFPSSATNNQGTKNNVPQKQSLEHVKASSKLYTRQNKTAQAPCHYSHLGLCH
jgi:hypothetical protein